MNIANIMGLHLGCKCKSDTDEFTLLGMRPSPFECEDTVYLQGEYNDLYDIKDCKLLLKPLSAISEEDKNTLIEKFLSSNGFIIKRILKVYSNEIRVNLEYPADKRRNFIWTVPLKGMLWLASKGYDIGITPKQYCEIVDK